jgi:flagellar biosynthesis protein FlhB
MACFLVPAAEAVAAMIITRSVRAGEKKTETAGTVHIGTEGKLPFSRKLKWLTNMLWGGAVLLAFEHVWHGEVTPWFPFLTAASSPTDAAAMLREMSAVGVGMAVLVTAVWAIMLVVSGAIEKRALKAPDAPSAAN